MREILIGKMAKLVSAVPTWLLIGAFIISAASSCFALLATSTHVFWEKVVLPTKSIQPYVHPAGKQGYVVALGTHRADSNRGDGCDAYLLENGKKLYNNNALHADIAMRGGGRHSFWSGLLIFSSSDGSDPRSNGRRYQVWWPSLSFSPFWALMSYALFFLMAALLVLRLPRLTKLIQLLFRRPNKPAIVFFTALFVLTLVKILLLLASPANHIHLTFYLGISGVLAFLAMVAARNTYGLTRYNIICLWLAFGMVISVFLITRLPFLVYYTYPVVVPDTNSYFSLAHQAFTGNWPHFGIRQPGYVLFVLFAYSIWHNPMFIIYLQSLLSLVSCLILVYGFYRFEPRLAIPVALAIAIHLSLSMGAWLDIAFLSESVFTSSLVTCLGMAALALASRKNWQFLVCSVMAGFAMITRPQGIMVPVFFIMLMSFMVLNRCSIKNGLYLFLPGVLILAVLFGVKDKQQGSVTLNDWQNRVLLAVTSTFWEPDPSFPSMVNVGIEAYRKEISRDDLQLINNSWDLPKLYNLFIKHTVNAMYKFGAENGERSFVYRIGDLPIRGLSNRIVLTAIQHHPDLYLKFVLSNLHTYSFPLISGAYLDLQEAIQLSYQYIQKQSVFKKGSYLEGFFWGQSSSEPVHSRYMNVTETAEGVELSLATTVLGTMQRNWQLYVSLQIYKSYWAYLFLLGLSAGMLKLFLSRFRDTIAFVHVACGLTLLGTVLVISLVHYAIARYLYPVTFLLFLVIFMVPYLFAKEKANSEE